MTAILYSFRRCPYAMRARLAIKISGIAVELREVVLRDKPQQMLDISAKGTVPVLVQEDGTVIDESFDIMLWALKQNDPGQWLNHTGQTLSNETLALIEENDGEFKYWLDHYKYADRYPESSAEYYRSQGEKFLDKLNQRLIDQNCLQSVNVENGNSPSGYPGFVDMAILPFIRQFANTDKNLVLRIALQSIAKLAGQAAGV